MKRIYRIFFHVLFWIIVWVILALNQNNFLKFLIENGIVFLFQIFLVTSLIYFFAPRLLFKKKYVLFIILSIILLTGLAFLASELMPILFRQMHPPRRPQGSRPSAFFIHFSLVSFAYVLATVVETFLFAQKKEEALLISKTENVTTELKLLKAQINPHFLFNSLNNIYALAAVDATKTRQSISYLSDMLRYVLYECEKTWVPLKQEVKYIDDYIRLFQLKSSKNYPINVHLQFEDPYVLIAPMLLIPFVENAFKHSTIEKVTSSFIDITLIAKDKDIEFTVRNSFSDKPQQKDATGGIGIKNVKRRLSIIYATNHNLSISDADNVFTVELKLKNNV